ncbi:hypothetical protein RFI_30316 [Reticulomyxa filosa]|uniref:Uncharacterized protein n=1 Tax=Reticulomyxa filosa TaxID=46433 RepID=X6M0Y7_RETFI|nr:hypothetical protein RFI_30316 [Reticulomyxa filosa]|eukprot:ETO07077.1 hypothetical protein RFI_30316 [Reticulomyxa filosa]
MLSGYFFFDVRKLKNSVIFNAQMYTHHVSITSLCFNEVVTLLDKLKRGFLLFLTMAAEGKAVSDALLTRTDELFACVDSKFGEDCTLLVIFFLKTKVIFGAFANQNIIKQLKRFVGFTRKLLENVDLFYLQSITKKHPNHSYKLISLIEELQLQFELKQSSAFELIQRICKKPLLFHVV